MPTIERVVFFGTPDFAVPSLAALVAAGRRPVLVVAQPARAAGRGGALREPPVAQWARAGGLEVAQPERVSAPEFVERMRLLDPDVAVVAAFGQIFSGALLEVPRLGCLNVHASLLPRWRGAAPIQAAVAAGETVTGVTIMQMERGLDTGPIWLQRELAVGPTETASALAARLAVAGGDLMVETLEHAERGDLVARPQDGELATYAPRLKKTDARVDWSLPAVRLFDRWRAYHPWPGLETRWRGEVVKILAAEPATEPAAAGAEPGTIVSIAARSLTVACGSGALDLLTLQRPGRRPQLAGELASGARLVPGSRFE